MKSILDVRNTYVHEHVISNSSTTRVVNLKASETLGSRKRSARWFAKKTVGWSTIQNKSQCSAFLFDKENAHCPLSCARGPEKADPQKVFRESDLHAPGGSKLRIHIWRHRPEAEFRFFILSQHPRLCLQILCNILRHQARDIGGVPDVARQGYKERIEGGEVVRDAGGHVVAPASPEQPK